MFVFAGQNEGQNGYSELSEAALTRLKSSLRPGSRANYITYFSTFLQFLHVFNITLHNIHQSHVISYIEWLAMSGLAYPTICNYLSGVKFYINYHHTFRHSGATLAFQLGVPLQDIQSHGTWASSAVWQYTSSATTSNVAHALHNNLSTTTLGLGSAGGANLC